TTRRGSGSAASSRNSRRTWRARRREAPARRLPKLQSTKRDLLGRRGGSELPPCGGAGGAGSESGWAEGKAAKLLAGPILEAKLHIESLVHGGEGLAHHEGRVVFVRGAAPGDLVEAELQGGGARFERTRALRVLEPGAAHVAAPCPIVDRCGGCPVQHVDYGAQLAAKSALTADALERIGGFAAGSYQLLPISPSPKQFRYRRRARLHRGK